MKVTRRDSDARGVGEAGWLHSRFSFSFADYYDPDRMGFGKLRVLNDDIIEGGSGFGMHPHANMEIITIVTRGTLAHKDSEGNGGIVTRGGVQVMSAGTGITHSEYNHDVDKQLELFQLWIETKQRGITPRYAQQSFVFPENTLVVVASGLLDAGALAIHQDARVSVGNFTQGNKTSYEIPKGSGVFALVIEGTFTIAGVERNRRDALEITDTELLSLECTSDGALMIVEVPL